MSLDAAGMSARAILGKKNLAKGALFQAQPIEDAGQGLTRPTPRLPVGQARVLVMIG